MGSFLQQAREIINSAPKTERKQKDAAELLLGMLSAVERGDMIIPPCPIGTPLYFISGGKTHTAPLSKYEIDAVGVHIETRHAMARRYSLEDVGKNVFFDRESLDRSCREHCENVMQALRAQGKLNKEV